MRLTLRTLLAHLDGVPLDPREADELTRKIEESEFVRNLVQRIRTSIARPRLPAPKIDGQGLGHDANTVAAYLDNTLPQDRMPELEKLCLESDVLLSEVAACHQILSLVLQHPAKTPQRLRERVYRIGDLGKAPPVEAAAPPAPPPPPPVQHAPPVAESAAPAVEKPAPARREIPEYLQKTRSIGWKPLAATVAVGFLLAAGLLLLLGPLDATHPVLGLFAGDSAEKEDVAQRPSDADEPAPRETQPAPDDAAKAPAGDGDSPLAKPSTAEPTTDRSEADPQPDEPSDAKARADGSEPPQPAVPEPVDDAAKPTTGDPDADAVSAAPVGDAAAPPEERSPVAPGISEVPADTVPLQPSEAAGGEAPRPSEDRESGAKPAPDELAATSPTTDAPIPAHLLPETVEGADRAAEPASPPFGRYISENEVLARFDRGAGDWVRLPVNAPLSVGERLLALPAYRPKIVLASGFQVTFSGGTLAELRAPRAPDAAHLAIDYGRAVIVPVGAAPGPVRLDLWGREGEVTFNSPGSLMAVHLRRYRSPGVDPEARLAHRMVEIYAVGGGLTWREAERPDQPIRAGETFAFLDEEDGAVAETEQLPAWVERSDVQPTDELAARDVQMLLALDRPLIPLLLELTAHRKSEVRALAIRSLAYLDAFDPLVRAFSDVGQKSYWSDHFNELQRALARSPETAQQARISLEKLRGRDAPILYRLLWSYSPEDLERGGAERLVDYLSHEALDVRVLAIENLRRITGGVTHIYRPEFSEVRRRLAVQRWRQDLVEGKVKYPEPVLMLPPRPLPEAAEAVE